MARNGKGVPELGGQRSHPEDVNAVRAGDNRRGSTPIYVKAKSLTKKQGLR